MKTMSRFGEVWKWASLVELFLCFCLWALLSDIFTSCPILSLIFISSSMFFGFYLLAKIMVFVGEIERTAFLRKVYILFFWILYLVLLGVHPRAIAISTETINFFLKPLIFALLLVVEFLENLFFFLFFSETDEEKER